MKWYPVELHTHTEHSDGDFTVSLSLIHIFPLADFAAAHSEARDLPACRMDGSARTVPHSSLCCLHQSEWEGVLPHLHTLLGL